MGGFVRVVVCLLCCSCRVVVCGICFSSQVGLLRSSCGRLCCSSCRVVCCLVLVVCLCVLTCFSFYRWGCSGAADAAALLSVGAPPPLQPQFRQQLITHATQYKRQFANLFQQVIQPRKKARFCSVSVCAVLKTKFRQRCKLQFANLFQQVRSETGHTHNKNNTTHDRVNPDARRRTVVPSACILWLKKIRGNNW